MDLLNDGVERYVENYIKDVFGDIGNFEEEYRAYKQSLIDKNKKDRTVYTVYLNGIPQGKGSDRSIDAKNQPRWIFDYGINKTKHYIVFEGNYNRSVESSLLQHGFQEIEDYFFHNPQPITIRGNGTYYSDKRGNEIQNMSLRAEVVFFGYGNKLRLPRDLSSGNMNIFLHNHSDIKINDGASFEEVRINVINMSRLYVGRSKFLKNAVIGCDTKSTMLIGDSCLFGRDNVFETCSFHKIMLGNNLLTSWGCTFLSGDGHAVFDLGKEKKINFERRNCRQQVLLCGGHTWIGQKALILKDTVIGSGCYIGGNSTVKGHFKNNSLIIGSPAKSKRENRAWHANPHASYKDRDGLYFLNTKFLSDRLLQFSWIQHLEKYCTLIAKEKNFICIIAVMDIIGHWIRGGEQESLSKIGVRKSLIHGEQRGYIFISCHGELVYEYITEKEEVTEYTGKLKGHDIHVLSAPLHVGCKAVIEIDGENYATNRRGLNFVLYDIETSQLVDSVAFDTHVKELTCYRKILFV